MNFDRKLHALQAEYLNAEAEVARLQNLIVYRGAESEEEITRRKDYLERQIDGIRGRSLRIQQEKLEKLTKQLEEYEP